jgi:hypothetical protein
MVKRYSDSGKSSWLEPPFTPEEELELAWINKPPVAVLRKPPEEPPKEGE